MSDSVRVLYYTPGTCALAVLAALHQVGEPFRLCRVPRDERLGPVYTTVNRLGRVPALRIDDEVLTEVSALLHHLSDRYPQAGLAPEPGTALGDRMEEWYSYLGSGLHIAFYPHFKPQLYLTDESLFGELGAAARVQIEKEFGAVDEHLSGNRYLLGDERSALDPYLFAMARWGKRLFGDYAERFPHLHRHLEEMREDPHVRFALAVEKGEIEGPDGALLGHVPLEPIASPRT